MGKKRKVVYQETYRAGSLMLRPESLPAFKHTLGAEVVSVEVRKAGAYDDGTEFEEMRVVFRPAEERHG